MSFFLSPRPWAAFPLLAATAGFCTAQDSKPLSNEPTKDEKGKTTSVVIQKVIDGDSVSVVELRKPQPVTMELQIEGIDAPELVQPFGPESKEALAKLLPVDSVVTVTWTAKDNYGRLLAQVTDRNKTHINSEMLRLGMAWHFKRYNQSKELATIEEIAKSKKLGLWAAPTPKAPWDYRRENKTPDRPASADGNAPKSGDPPSSK